MNYKGYNVIKMIVIQVHVRYNSRDFGIKIEVFEPGIINVIRFYLPVGKGRQRVNGEKQDKMRICCGC